MQPVGFVSYHEPDVRDAISLEMLTSGYGGALTIEGDEKDDVTSYLDSGIKLLITGPWRDEEREGCMRFITYYSDGKWM